MLREVRALLDRMVSEPWFSERLGETNKINFQQLKEIAQDTSRSTADNLVAYAHSIMLALFDEQAQALDELRSNGQSDGERSEALENNHKE